MDISITKESGIGLLGFWAKTLGLSAILSMVYNISIVESGTKIDALLSMIIFNTFAFFSAIIALCIGSVLWIWCPPTMVYEYILSIASFTGESWLTCLSFYPIFIFCSIVNLALIVMIIIYFKSGKSNVVEFY